MLGIANVTEWELGPGERYDLILEGAAIGSWIASMEYLDDHTGGVLGSVQTQISVQ